MICDEKLGPPNTTYMVKDAFITENRDNLLFFFPQRALKVVRDGSLLMAFAFLINQRKKVYIYSQRQKSLCEMKTKKFVPSRNELFYYTPHVIMSFEECGVMK